MLELQTEMGTQYPEGGNLRIILRGLRAVVTIIVFDPLLITPDNPWIILGGAGNGHYNCL